MRSIVRSSLSTVRRISTSTPLLATKRPMSSSSFWASVALAPPDKILGLTEAFKADSHPKKINLGVGAYRTNDGKPIVLPSVRIAEQRILDRNTDKEYAPISGVPAFVERSLEFAYGSDSEPMRSKRIAAAQAISGTGACRLAGEFLRKFVGEKPIYIPSPTWGNHVAIFTEAGLKPSYYPYYDSATRSVDFDKLLAFVEQADNESIFLLHACAHNPTGCDPSVVQWETLSRVMKAKQHIVVFDSAYQGFASGNPEADAHAIRHFVAEGHEILLCQSFAKNFGLYGERAGMLSIVTESAEEAERVNSQLKLIVRPMYSNPPVHGARLVAEVLSDEFLKKQWLGECKSMADRIIQMRALLRSKLEAGSTRPWNHITDQIGMFCFTGLTKDQVMRLRNEFHIYCTEDGRFSMAGINEGNIEHLASSVLAVL